MKAVIKRDLRNFLKNPILWIGMILVIAGIYQNVSPYLNIHYFSSDQEIESLKDKPASDAEVMDGYIPVSANQQKELGLDVIMQTMEQELGYTKEECLKIREEVETLEIPEIVSMLSEKYNYYGAYYTFHRVEQTKGTAEEVNAYISEKMENRSFSYYFSRKFADFCGLYMGFFATVLFAFLFLRDTSSKTYELLHTKPISAGQYIMGKIAGGFLVSFLIIGILNVIFMILCKLSASRSDFTFHIWDFIYATTIYILPNMLMIICVYTIVSLIFKNPLPAVPLLLLYMIYSNMGSYAADGTYGYYGRPMAIMVRFPGGFFETTPPPMVLLNQIFMILASALIIALAIFIWKRRRVY